MVRSRAEYLIKKLISNTLSEKELGELLEGLDKDESLQEYSPVLEQYFNDLIEQNSQNYKSEWEVNNDKGTASAQGTTTQKHFHLFNTHYGRLAAFIVLVFGLGIAYYFYSSPKPSSHSRVVHSGPTVTPHHTPTKETIVPRGKRKNLQLSDGSVVKLNSDTKISFPAIFGQDGRVVSLNGEAFFDVERDETRPFIIALNAVKINVLGTSFNVKDYDDEQEVEITVRSGLVSVSFRSDQSTPILVRKDQKLIFNKTNEKFQIIGVNAEQENSWITGALQFNNTPLRRVKQTLEKWYDVDIIIEEPSLYQASLTGTHLNESLVSMLESITYAIDARYEIKGRTVILRN
ncbi:hypothetical protein GCM10027347_20390 [Larkinella harenae]